MDDIMNEFEKMDNEFIDRMDVDQDKKKELKKMSRLSAIRNYVNALKTNKWLSEQNDRLLKEKYVSMEKELHAVYTLEQIKKLHEPQASEANYNVDWTWITKIVFMLERCNRPMKSLEIINRLWACDDIVKSMNDPQKQLSFYFNKAVKYQRILTYKIKGIRGYYYILPNWMKDGLLKENYEKQIFIYK